MKVPNAKQVACKNSKLNKKENKIHALCFWEITVQFPKAPSHSPSKQLVREVLHGEPNEPNQANKELDNLRTPAQTGDTRKKKGG
jgi:hypothetical protein